MHSPSEDNNLIAILLSQIGKSNQVKPCPFIIHDLCHINLVVEGG